MSTFEKKLDAMSEDYSDGLSELTSTITALTSVANAKKICPRSAFQHASLGVGRNDCYENIAVLVFHHDCDAAPGQRDPSGEVLEFGKIFVTEAADIVI